MPWFKRAYRGLYGNRMIQFGNKISFAENKTRRTWKPNVQKKTLWSETLREPFKTKLTTHVMRCIRKFGGFDEYLLRTKDSEIKYPRALEFKRRIIEVRKEQRKLGLVQNNTETPSDETDASTKPSPIAAPTTTASQSSPNSPLSKTPPAMMRASRGLLDIL